MENQTLCKIYLMREETIGHHLEILPLLSISVIDTFLGTIDDVK